MKFYIEDFFSDEDKKLFQKIRLIILALPDSFNLGCDKKGEEIVLSCHILSRAIANTIDCGAFKVIDGTFANGLGHSWLQNDKGDIIDVYPVGTLGGPIMICGHSELHTKMIYFPAGDEGKREYKKLFSHQYLQKSVAKVSLCMKIIEKSG